MRSSKPDKTAVKQHPKGREARNFTQLGLDLTPTSTYSYFPRKESEPMNHELFESLDNKVADLLNKYQTLKEENARLTEENERFKSEREAFKSRIDAILGKLDGI
jgi:cell division protein ZapB